MARRRIFLSTAGHVATELGRLYKDARTGTVEWQDAVAGSIILHRLRQALESVDLEVRLRELEERYGQEAKARPNGRGHTRAYPHARS